MHHVLCPRLAKSRLFSTTSTHGSQGFEFYTPCTPCHFALIMHASVGGRFFWGVHGTNNLIIGVVRAVYPRCARVVRKHPHVSVLGAAGKVFPCFPGCPPLFPIFCPRVGDPEEGTGGVAIPPTRGPPKREGLGILGWRRK